MLTLFRYTIKMVFRQRACLKQVMLDQNSVLSRIEDLRSDYLMDHQIKLLALDFDGVLGCHGAVQPTASVVQWLHQLSQGYSLQHVCLYSNNLFDERVEFFEKNFPAIKIIYYTQKKPFPEDLLHEIQSRQLTPPEVLVIDDRLTAGVLSACIAGAKAMLLKHPVVDYRKETAKECYFTLVRFLERLFVR